MKLLITFSPLSLLFIENIASAFTIRYYNKDSKNYEMEVRSNGATQKVEFNSSTTGSTSNQTSASEVEIKTACGWVKVKYSTKIVIKDGCITIE